MHKIIKRLASLSAIGMFIVLVMGALVTKTESGRGCGDDWPLCNGKFVPAYTISSFIEYSHRAVVGIVTLLLVVTALLVFRYIKRSDARLFVAGAVFFTLLQAVLGAMAVKWPQSSAILALHFGLSLLAFACTLLLALVFTRWGDYTSKIGGNLTKGLRILVWVTAIYCYAVVYLGAFVRHTVSSGGCSGWPLCNGQLIPDMSGATGIVYTHRIAALLLFFCILILFLTARKGYHPTEPIVQGSKWAFILVLTQVISGAVVTWSIGNDLFYLFAGMMHAVIIACLFGLLSYLCVLTFYYKKTSIEIR
ncbi:COX15/CtaA family protein [Paenibacillus sp. GP183]|uniref:COX15/CtaA family protein n=1 Tax=Paenibacillus sp. GP183 TaxID=1882751 RepID=UPI0008950027|nr:COX15/CtaA family protein [Paenibacillus sp. GP183]SEC66229.1 cytochrome c oxidase assembly protein subunit 15 [Paenibacillus sp. GP183]